MSKQSDKKFVKLLWKEKFWDQNATLNTTDGQTVSIVKFGSEDELSDSFFGVQLIINGSIQTGTITFDDSNIVCTQMDILQVAIRPTHRLSRESGELLPQLVLPVSDSLVRFYQKLVANSDRYRCGDYIASMESCHRLRRITRLMFERLERKHGELLKIHKEGDNNWNHTLYVLLFKVMGSPYNKIPFAKLASRVPYNAVSHEKGSLEMVEAMLLGGAGLLQIREEQDDYIRRMRANFEHLRAKYNIMPMHAGEWKQGGTRPNGAATLRIAQLAAFLAKKEFLFDNVIRCRNASDIHRIFSIEASDYWSTQFSSGNSLQDRKRVGHERMDVLGINLVVPLMFAYAEIMADEPLTEIAIELLERIPPENNKIVAGWHKSGVQFKSAFDTQAMIQLFNEYCLQQRCAECPFGKAQIHDKFNMV